MLVGYAVCTSSGKTNSAYKCVIFELKTLLEEIQANNGISLIFLLEIGRRDQGGRGLEKMKINRQSDKKKTKQVRIDVVLHKELKIKAAAENTTIKSLIEGSLSEVLSRA